MDILTASPVVLVQAELLSRILRRRIGILVSGAHHAGVNERQHSRNLQISAATGATKSPHLSSFIDLITLLEGMRVELTSVRSARSKVGRSCSIKEFYRAVEASIGDSVSDPLQSLRTEQLKTHWTKPDGERDSASISIDGDPAEEFETMAEDAKRESDKGTSGKHAMSHQESRAKNGKKTRRKIVGRVEESEDQTTEDEKFMSEALLEAKKAASVGEVPVGAVIVQQGRIIARAFNRVETQGDPTAHAEMLCIRRASKATGDWRLTDATIYVTMEPCAMCAGALLQARVKRVVWGARNSLLGADGSWVSLFPGSRPRPEPDHGDKQPHHPFHKTVEVRREILPDDCSIIVRSFFRSRRKGEAIVAKRKPRWLSFEFWLLLRKLLG